MKRKVKYIALVLALLSGSVSAEEADSSRVILFFGDSLTAGYDSTANRLSRRWYRRGLIRSAGALKSSMPGLAGETSAGGLRRIDWLLRRPIDVFVLELGGQ